MKIRALSLLYLIAFTSSAQVRVNIAQGAESIRTVAVVGKTSVLCNGLENDGQSLAEVVEGELLSVYDVVERRYLNEILNEQKLALGGLVMDEEAYAKAGCLAGAEGTVVCSYGCLSGRPKIQVKMIDCSSSNLFWSAAGMDVNEFQLVDELVLALKEGVNDSKSPQQKVKNQTKAPLRKDPGKQKRSEGRKTKTIEKDIENLYGLILGGTLSMGFSSEQDLRRNVARPMPLLGFQWRRGSWLITSKVWQRGAGREFDGYGVQVERITAISTGVSFLFWQPSESFSFTVGGSVEQLLGIHWRWIDSPLTEQGEPLFSESWEGMSFFSEDWELVVNSGYKSTYATAGIGAVLSLDKAQVGLEMVFDVIPYAITPLQLDGQPRQGSVALTYTHLFGNN